MPKNTRLSVKLASHESPCVKSGDRVKRGDVLIKSSRDQITELNLSKILKIKPDQVSRYLCVKINFPVQAGSLIAKKRKLLKVHVVKAPVSGELVWVNQTKGIIGIREEPKISEITAWFDGIVDTVNDEEIGFNVAGILISGKAGQGALITGILRILMPDVTVLTMPSDLEKQILVLKSADSDMVAKADALGAVAIVTEIFEQPPFALPYLLVSDITKIHTHHEKFALLYGDKHQLLILDEEKKPANPKK